MEPGDKGREGRGIAAPVGLQEFLVRAMFLFSHMGRAACDVAACDVGCAGGNACEEGVVRGWKGVGSIGADEVAVAPRDQVYEVQTLGG